MKNNYNYYLPGLSEAQYNDVLLYAITVLKSGGVILTPTDTVYGLLCSPHSRSAVEHIFEMKERPFNWHLPIVVADKEQAEKELPLVWTSEAHLLTDAFWPGALTVAFGIQENELPWLEGRNEVGIRAPAFRFVQDLARTSGPLLMTSANRHGTQTPHTVEGALDSLSLRPEMVINGGELSGAASTLVNVNLPHPVIEREGTIPDEEIMRILHNG